VGRGHWLTFVQARQGTTEVPGFGDPTAIVDPAGAEPRKKNKSRPDMRNARAE
jgi:hypothetical protein